MAGEESILDLGLDLGLEPEKASERMYPTSEDVPPSPGHTFYLQRAEAILAIELMSEGLKRFKRNSKLTGYELHMEVERLKAPIVSLNAQLEEHKARSKLKRKMTDKEREAKAFDNELNKPRGLLGAVKGTKDRM